jgi:hypothetical protein
VVVKPERPAPVLVLALASLACGALGLIGAGVAQVICWPLGSLGSPAAVVPLESATAQNLRETLPGFRAYEVVVPGAATVLAALVLVTGLALLSMRRWARAAAVVVAGAVLLAQLAMTLYGLAVVVPGAEDWRQRAGRHPERPAPPDFPHADLSWVGLLLLIGGLIFFVHAVATIVVLHAPAVAEAFARGRRAEAPAEGNDHASPH